MELELQVTLLFLPAMFVVLVVYLMMKHFTEIIRNMILEEGKKRLDITKRATNELVNPLRIQAYERMILFLERISPTSLVMRLHQSGISAQMLHAELLKAIRSEYEHNMSQQIYLSIKTWEMIKVSKEETIKLINMTINKMPDHASGLNFGEALIQIASQIKKLPTEVGIDYLKKEFAESF